MSKGKIVQVMGPVVDVVFENGDLPDIKDALEVENNGKKCVMEVSQHLGNDVVRCIMLSASEGLQRDREVVATGSGIKVPVGDCTLGRLFNVLGETVVGLPLPAILIPFIIAALMRIALGSATVAITTAASLTAPLMAAISVSPILLAASCCVGAISFSYFNDSGFWVFNGMFGLTELKDQVRCKTAVSLIMAGVGIIELLLLQFVL